MLCLPSEVIFLSGIQTFISPYNKGHTYIISPFISGQWYVVKSVLDVNGGHTTAILTFFAFFTTPLHLMMWALVLLKCGNTCIPASFHCICILPLGRFLFKVVTTPLPPPHHTHTHKHTHAHTHYVFFFVHKIFFRTTREFEYLFFLSRKNLTYDKNSESDFVFFFHRNQNIFSATLGIRIFF